MNGEKSEPQFESQPEQELEKEPEIKIPEDIEKLEEELSPEIIEKIMEKVQDIAKPEVGYHVIQNVDNHTQPELLKQILKDGLLGADFFSDAMRSKAASKEDWAKSIKQRNAVIFFNITGRGSERFYLKGDETEIAKSNYVDVANQGKVIVLFNLEKFKEEESTLKKRNEGGRPRLIKKNNTYQGDHFDKITDYSEDGVDTEYGFILRQRVAPRFFTGIVIKLTRPLTQWEIQKGIQEGKREFDLIHNYGAENINALVPEAQRIANVMQKTDKGKEELLVPIYDIRGNLLWPKKMYREEVKKFVEERDSKKSEEE